MTTENEKQETPLADTARPMAEKTKAAYAADLQVAGQIDPGETVLISGFWRSGTTWLLETITGLLQAKVVFEPFSPRSPKMKEFYDHYRLSAERVRILRMFLPFCESPTLEGHILYDFFENALRSTLPGGWVRQARKGVEESYRTRVVLKCVRAQLCLRAAQNTFNMPAIHLYRDPRAIVASIKMTEWNWLFDHLKLRKMLLKIRDGRAAFFRKWRDEMQEFDRQDNATRIAAYWALTEKFVQESYKDNQANIAFVSYEDLCRRREERLLEIVEKLRLPVDWPEKLESLDRDSVTTTKARRGVSIDERIAGWKKILTASEISAVEFVARHFGFEDRLD